MLELRVVTDFKFYFVYSEIISAFQLLERDGKLLNYTQIAASFLFAK